MSRARAAAAAVALVSALALPTAAPAAAGPVAGAAPLALPEAERLLADVERRVAQVAAQLTEGALEYERGEAELGAAQSSAVAADRAVEQAAADAGTARAAAREAVRARYRNPAPAGLHVLVELRAGRLPDALAVRTALARTQQRTERGAADAAAHVGASVDTRTRAEQVRAQVGALGRQQADRLRALREAATQAQAELADAAARLQQAQEADRRARAEQRARAQTQQAQTQQAQTRAKTRQAQQTQTQQAQTRAAQARQPDLRSGCRAGPVRAANGLLPDAALCPLATARGHRLVPAAARAYDALSRAYEADTGAPLCLTDSYRSYPEQVRVFAAKPGLAAVPGTSNHGWGRAVDLCGGVQTFGTAAHGWMQEHAPAYGWTHPAWAEPGGSRPEPWHWEHPGT